MLKTASLTEVKVLNKWIYGGLVVDPLLYCMCYSPYLSLPKVNSGTGYCFIPLHPL